MAESGIHDQSRVFGDDASGHVVDMSLAAATFLLPAIVLALQVGNSRLYGRAHDCMMCERELEASDANDSDATTEFHKGRRKAAPTTSVCASAKASVCVSVPVSMCPCL
jgi:hypothetical protein